MLVSAAQSLDNPTVVLEIERVVSLLFHSSAVRPGSGRKTAVRRGKWGVPRIQKYYFVGKIQRRGPTSCRKKSPSAVQKAAAPAPSRQTAHLKKTPRKSASAKPPRKYRAGPVRTVRTRRQPERRRTSRQNRHILRNILYLCPTLAFWIRSQKAPGEPGQTHRIRREGAAREPFPS